TWATALPMRAPARLTCPSCSRAMIFPRPILRLLEVRGETPPGSHGDLLHQRYAFRPRRHARALSSAVRLGRGDERGAGRAVERDGGLRRCGLASRRLR